MSISITLRSLCRTPVIMMPSTGWKQTRVRPFNRRIGTRARTLVFFVFGGPNRAQLQVCVVYRVPVVVYVSGFTHFQGCCARSNPNPKACRFHLTGSRPISLGFFPLFPPHICAASLHLHCSGNRLPDRGRRLSPHAQSGGDSISGSNVVSFQIAVDDVCYPSAICSVMTPRRKVEAFSKM